MAGFLYFLCIGTTIVADVIDRSKLIVFGDGAATANNIMASDYECKGSKTSLSGGWLRNSAIPFKKGEKK